METHQPAQIRKQKLQFCCSFRKLAARTHTLGSMNVKSFPSAILPGQWTSSTPHAETRKPVQKHFARFSPSELSALSMSTACVHFRRTWRAQQVLHMASFFKDDRRVGNGQHGLHAHHAGMSTPEAQPEQHAKTSEHRASSPKMISKSPALENVVWRLGLGAPGAASGRRCLGCGIQRGVFQSGHCGTWRWLLLRSKSTRTRNAPIPRARVCTLRPQQK